MIRKMAWNIFKNTGDVNTYLEYKQIQNIENGINLNAIIDDKIQMNQQMEEQNGNSQNEWYNNF